LRTTLLLVLALSVNAQTPAPPPVAASFASNVNGAADLFPADAAGAVGPNHVVGVTNGGFVVQSRTGQVLQNKSLIDLRAIRPANGFVFNTTCTCPAASSTSRVSA
jgi:hypothetical protein